MRTNCQWRVLVLARRPLPRTSNSRHRARALSQFLTNECSELLDTKLRHLSENVFPRSLIMYKYLVQSRVVHKNSGWAWLDGIVPGPWGRQIN